MASRKGLQGATQDVVRRHNLAALFDHVHRHGPTTRAELTRSLDLNRSTIAALVDDLSGRGLVSEGRMAGPASPGRPSNLVSVRSDRVAAIAVVLGVDAVTVAVAALGGQIVDRVEVPLEDGPARAFDRVVTTVGCAIGELVGRQKACADLVGVGVAVPGVVRSQDGLVHFAPNLGWREMPLGQHLADRVEAQLGRSLPVLCRNDAGLGAIAEHTRGIGAGVANLVYLHAEVGVGGGIIADGRLLEGSAGYSGEVGHLRVNPEGMPCRCGSSGCWETEVGEDALVTLAGRRPGGPSVVHEVLRAVGAGEPAAVRAMDHVGRWVGIGLANIVNILNPDMVVLGGLFADVLELGGAGLAAQMRAGLVTPAQLDVQLVPPQLGAESVLLGAAEVAFAPLLTDPTTVSLSPRRR